MLYRPEAFERLTDEPWDENRVRAAIQAIVSDADDVFDPDRLWPADEWDGWRTPRPLTSLYVGAAGVIWALDVLRRRGHAETRLDLADAAHWTLRRRRERPDFMAGVELPAERDASLLSGETGVLLVTWRLTSDDELADNLLARVRENLDNPADELMWGTPGTMLAARAMLDWTGEERWADVWRQSADVLMARRGADGLWAQHTEGEVYRGLGPVHGLVGNVLVLLGGGELLGTERRRLLVGETGRILAETVVREDGLANWPLVAGGDLLGTDGQVRVQWCAGAPGIVASASSYLDEELLLAGAELTWRCGPPGAEKGAGLCHGTAGSGYAFLKAFERTGDERWLERARRFAVHALGQVEQARRARGHGRYSLWTGDVGVALYAAGCLDHSTGYPILDTI